MHVVCVWQPVPLEGKKAADTDIVKQTLGGEAESEDGRSETVREVAGIAGNGRCGLGLSINVC